MVGDAMLHPRIADSALVDAFCTIDAGMPYKQTTSVGPGSWLQKRVHVGHNTVIGADCEICVGVVLGGEVTIGDGVKIAANSWVKPLVTIGDGAIIGGGSVVTKDVPAHEVWAGNPARYMKLAWTHPDYQPEFPKCVDEVPAAAARYPDREEVWEMMRPYHHRDAEALSG